MVVWFVHRNLAKKGEGGKVTVIQLFDKVKVSPVIMYIGSYRDISITKHLKNNKYQNISFIDFDLDLLELELLDLLSIYKDTYRHCVYALCPPSPKDITNQLFAFCLLFYYI